jgi:hypothetical protein
MSKAIVVHEHGGSEALRLEERRTTGKVLLLPRR